MLMHRPVGNFIDVLIETPVAEIGAHIIDY